MSNWQDDLDGLSLVEAYEQDAPWSEIAPAARWSIVTWFAAMCAVLLQFAVWAVPALPWQFHLAGYSLAWVCVIRGFALFWGDRE